MLDSWGCVQSSPTFSSEFVLLLVPVLLAPTALSFCWWRLTPLPKHQSQSVESPSGKWIPSSTLGVQLTDRGAWTEMSEPGLARPEQFLSCSRTSGRPRRSGQEPNLASSTPMWSQSCFTDAKLGGQCYRKSRHSSTPVCGASTISDGQRWPQMKVFPLAWHNFQECGPRQSPHKKTCTIIWPCLTPIQWTFSSIPLDGSAINLFVYLAESIALASAITSDRDFSELSGFICFFSDSVRMLSSLNPNINLSLQSSSC